MIRLLPSQIAPYWQHIRFVALAVNPQLLKEEDIGEYCRNLLVSLLAGKTQAWLAVKDGRIQGMTITRIMNDVGGMPNLLVDALYGFEPIEDKEKHLESMKRFARNIGCKGVIGYPMNQMAANGCKNAGMIKVADIYYISV
jgi:hypothetical protein